MIHHPQAEGSSRGSGKNTTIRFYGLLENKFFYILDQSTDRSGHLASSTICTISHWTDNDDPGTCGYRRTLSDAAGGSRRHHSLAGGGAGLPSRPDTQTGLNTGNADGQNRTQD